MRVLILYCAAVLLLGTAAAVTFPGHAAGAPEARGHGESGDVVVTVDGEPVTRGDVLRRIRSAKGNIEPSAMDPEQWRKIVATATKSEIIDRLLLKAALAEGMDIDGDKLEHSVGDMKEQLGEEGFLQLLKVRNATEEEFRKFVRERMLMEKYKAALFKEAAVDEDEVRGHYEKHRDSYGMPHRVRLGAMVAESEEKAKEALEKLKQGEEFGAVTAACGAAGRSINEEGVREAALDSLADEVRPLVAAAGDGDLLGPVHSPQGYYVIQVVEQLREEPASYDEVSDRIRKKLLGEKRLAILDTWYEAEQVKARIEYQ